MNQQDSDEDSSIMGYTFVRGTSVSKCLADYGVFEGGDLEIVTPERITLEREKSIAFWPLFFILYYTPNTTYIFNMCLPLLLSVLHNINP